MMPLGALAIVIFVGWVLPPDRFKEELEANGQKCGFFRTMLFMVRYVLPLAILIIFANGLYAWFAGE